MMSGLECISVERGLQWSSSPAAVGNNTSLMSFLVKISECMDSAELELLSILLPRKSEKKNTLW